LQARWSNILLNFDLQEKGNGNPELLTAEVAKKAAEAAKKSRIFFAASAAFLGALCG
jgi:hypothetical protein